jgi:2-keto-4-pentenoate hydratase/2-oxohepta-3-ene-1,7-dioic acid hydratase in catechol pathway
MRFANLSGRAAVVLDGDRIADLDKASEGRFGPSPSACHGAWEALKAWVAANEVALNDAAVPLRPGELGPPSPVPRQVFAIGLNYAAHAAESGLARPELPTTFTKFPTCLTGPNAVVDLPSDSVDWELELVVVIGLTAHRVAAGGAWPYPAI